MIRRDIESKLAEALSFQPAVVLLGPRQVGKTTLAKHVQSTLSKPSYYFDLERQKDLQKFQKDAETFLESMQDSTVILDEVQQLPNIFSSIRGLIDRNRVPGRFIFLGSASPVLLKNTSESLAGRVSYLEMSPFLFRELEDDLPSKHWLTGGFPKAYLANSQKERYDWQENFIRTYFERDLPMLGLNANPMVLRRLLQMLASVQGGQLNQNMLANSLGIRNTLVKEYVDFFEHAFLIRRLQPYYTNIGKRLVKSPKVYVRDSGIVHHVLGINNYESLIGHMVAGGSWEGYVVEQIIALLGDQQFPFFFRTSNGAELDLVIEEQLKIKLAIEIKLTNAPTISKGNTVALQDLGNPPLLIVTPSCDDYLMRSNVWVCSVKTLPENLKRLGIVSSQKSEMNES